MTGAHRGLNSCCFRYSCTPSRLHQVVLGEPKQHVSNSICCHFHCQMPALVVGGLQQWHAFSVSSSRHNSRSSNNYYSSRDTISQGTLAVTAAAMEDAVSGEDSRRRRRGTTESRAALRRTTESKSAIEDVAVMNKSQLTRRNKAWLTEQCWERKLPYDGLKDDLVNLLLDWQQTDAGRAAAASATSAAAAAVAPHAHCQLSICSSSNSSSTSVKGADQCQSPPARMIAAAAAERVSRQDDDSGMGDLAQPHQSASSRRKRRQSTSSSSSTSALIGQLQPKAATFASGDGSTLGSEADCAAAPASLQVQQPPRNAAEASLDMLRAVLQQLQQQTDNPAVIALARKALEAHVQRNCESFASSSFIDTCKGGLICQDGAAAALCQVLLESSSPQSLAVVAKACFSREQQQPVLAAAMAAAVATVAQKLGPQQVYGVLRLLAEHLQVGHLGNDEGDELAMAMQKGFQVLAEGMITCSEVLSPVQLAEAVQLLQHHRYSDPYGLWMLAKQAARRLQEFRPSEVTAVLDAIADMCVADESLCQDVAVVVLANKEVFNGQQLQQVQAALQRMGYSTPSSFL